MHSPTSGNQAKAAPALLPNDDANGSIVKKEKAPRTSLSIGRTLSLAHRDISLTLRAHRAKRGNRSIGLARPPSKAGRRQSLRDGGKMRYKSRGEI